MFDSLTNSLSSFFDRFRGKGKLTEENIKEGLKEVRRALLAADVHFQVVKDFLKSVTEKAVGKEVIESVRPSEQIIKVVHDELVALMGEGDQKIENNPNGPTVIMMCGLQGSGKTTTCGKLAKYFKEKGRRPMLVAADLQRPAAVEQLKVVAGQVGVEVYAEEKGRPVKVCQRSIEEAWKRNCDLVILDTAGRLHIDKELMDELKSIQESVKPQNVLLVLDSMVGQDAVNSAKEFNTQLEIDGVILTKLDGDTRGGAALSVRAVTGKPIKFIGMGEKMDKLELFHPDRMASRILGMGDIVSLVEKAQEVVSQDEAQTLRDRLKKGQFNFEDFLDQMQKINKMGSLKNLLGMLPGVGRMMQGVDEDAMQGQLKRTRAIMQSMTPEERKKPEIINGPRRLRIANGSGTSVGEVNQLLKQFKEMKLMMKKMTRGGLSGLKNMAGMGGGPLG